MTTIHTQDRVAHVVATCPDGPATSKYVAERLSITRDWACCILAELVARGILDVANADGGTYEWTTR